MPVFRDFYGLLWVWGWSSWLRTMPVHVVNVFTRAGILRSALSWCLSSVPVSLKLLCHLLIL